MRVFIADKADAIGGQVFNLEWNLNTCSREGRQLWCGEIYIEDGLIQRERALTTGFLVNRLLLEALIPFFTLFVA